MNMIKKKIYRRQKRHDKQMWKKEVNQEIITAGEVEETQIAQETQSKMEKA